MACLNAMFKRVKQIFSTKKEQQQTTGDNDKSGSNSLMTVTVNRFASIDERQISLMVERLGDEGKGECRSGRTRNRSASRKIFSCFSFSSSSDQSVNPTDLSFCYSSEGLDVQNAAVTRYRREFHEVEQIGKGTFGFVYQCLNRLDGCVYAVKRSRALARSKYAQRKAANEVQANAVLNGHVHVVRYFSAWIEDDCMNIQQEYCNGGDLGKVITKMRQDKITFEENVIRKLLLHVGRGLRFIHGKNLAHMDIKPENIFISQERVWNERSGTFIEEVIYKIGDMGHVTSISNVLELEDEGDCRYLSKEVLREDYRDLTKADIFALGMMAYEACLSAPLPKNGPKWHDIREGKLKKLVGYSDDLSGLIKLMVHLEPEKRPSAAKLTRREFLHTAQSPTDE